MNRILFFVHYHKYNNLADYVIYLLQHIKHLYSKVVFISNSLLDEQQNSRLVGLYNSIILRENKGFDFGAWKDALLQEGWDNLAAYDNITLMNDSCFGPFYDMEAMYNQMEQKDVDFWGVTDYKATKAGMPGTNKSVPTHIQSYFMCFTNKIIRKEFFKNFWEKVVYEKDVHTVVQKYETRLTNLLKKKGFNCGSLLEAQNKENMSIMTPDFCIMNSSPFVKIKSFLYFSYPKYFLRLIQTKTNYPVSLIIDHISDVYDPSISLTIADKTVSLESPVNNVPLTQLPKIAVHLHVFYMDIFEKYVDIFDNWVFKYHLFITTDTPEKKQIIANYLQGRPSYRNLEEILVFQNHGRDILPWLSIAEKLNPYDIVGHFHTKKTLHLNPFIGLGWQQELIDLLLAPISTIIGVFNENKKVGIVIPNIPYYFQLNPIIVPQEESLKTFMSNLWKKMNCKRELYFQDFLAFIFSYGNMFWYRPLALQPLFDLQPRNMKIPKEPLPDESILHGIERILVYIAWSQGFDYRITTYTAPQVSVFNNTMIINKTVTNSRDYKVGRFLLTIPRLIKRIIVRLKY